MSLYPPPPPGWDTRKAPSVPPPDPAAEERALVGWAQTRGFELNLHPDVRWYQAWAPFVYFFTPTRVGRELKAATHEANAWIVEAFDESSGAPDDAFVVAFVTSPRLQHRGAIRSRLQKEAIDELRASFNPRRTPRPNVRWRWREREGFLRRTYGRGVRGVIGDAIFEAHFEIATPTREEGNAAFPVALRHFLVHGGWRGILELRPGGMVVAGYGPPMFDPASLDTMLATLGQIYATATRNDGVVPSGTLIDGPPSSVNSSVSSSRPRSSK